MTESTATRSFSQESFDAFLATRNEPDWMTTRRREAWDMFQKMEWPGRREEEWIRTDIRLFKLGKFEVPSPADATEDLTAQALLAEGVELGGWSSSNCKFELNEKWASKGVIFGSLDKLVGEHGDLIREYFLSKAVDPSKDRFAALHAAFWCGGHFLYVPKGVVVDEPLHAMSAMGDGNVDLGHTLAILEEGAEATFMTENVSPSASAGGLHCGAIELFVAPGATCGL